MRKNSNIIRAFDALTIVKGINSLGGPDKQVYYIESDVYAPDRRITPLLLQPYVNVYDPNGIITAGDKVSELVDGAWYVDAIDQKNRVTKSSVGSTLDDPFTIGDNHRLMVRLNTDKSVMLFFEGDYYDSRKGSKIHISLSYMLSTTHNSQNKPAPKVLLSKGASYTYNPLDDLTELIIESQLADDGKLLRGAVEWCEVEGTKITAISDAMPYYISGQHSDKLKINPSLMGDVVIRARNVSEEIYNKAYGVNPEWDNRMKEVFENRNLVRKDSLIINAAVGNAIEGDDETDFSINPIRFSLVIPITAGKPYSISYEKQSGIKRFSFGFYTQYKERETGKIGWFNWADNSIKKFENYVAPANTKYLIIYLGWTIKDFPIDLKVEEGDKVTPYTPAPEDLNFRNLITNGDFKQKSNSWLVSQSTVKFDKIGYCEIKSNGTDNYPYIQQYITPNEELCYVTFMHEPPTNGGAGFSLLSQKGNLNTTLKTINTKEKGHLSILANLNNGYFRFNQSFSTAELAKANPYSIGNINIINLTQTFGKGNEPTKEQLDEVFKDMPYIPSPYDYAPDGIVKGTYQSDMKFTPLYPNIEANVVYLTTPVIKKGVERIKAQAVLSTNKKTITNPEKHFDLKWILKPTTAGGSETVVGTGEFVDIPVANLPEGRVIGLDLDYNFKKQ